MKLIFFITACALSLAPAAAIHAENPQQPSDQAIVLNAGQVQIKGPNAKLEGGDPKDIIWWTNTDTSLQWKAAVPQPGKYSVALNYAIIGGNNGSELGITVGGKTVTATPKAGSGVSDYQTGYAGDVTIDKAGNIPVIVKALHRGREFVINIRYVSLVSADSPKPALDITGNAVQQSDDGSLKLPVTDAGIYGMNAQLESSGEEKSIEFWKDLDTSVAWNAQIQTPGKYRVEMSYSLAPNCVGSKVAITIGGQMLKAKPKAGKNWKDYKTGSAGEITIEKTGNVRVIVKPISKHQDYVVNLRSISLIPAVVPAHAIDIADQPAKQTSSGVIKLTADDSEIDGQTARLEGGDKKYLVWWNSTDSSVQWPFIINESGLYNVEVTYSLANSDSDSELEISAGDQKISAKIKHGHSLDDFKKEKVGELLLNAGQPLQLILTSTMEPGGLVMHLRSVTLTRVPKK